MPHTFEVEDDVIKCRAKLAGVRRFLFFLPYFTYSRPRIDLLVSVKGSQYKVFSVAVDCDNPQAKWNNPYHMNRINYGWFAGELRHDGRYQTKLPPLIGGGVQYEYRVSIGLHYQHKEQEENMFRGGVVMTTGYVPHQERIVLGVIAGLLPILGGLATLLFQHFFAP